ncbi:Hemerythrin HHE cation binding domain-containing protein [Raineyella antarctica]|uniref:Hemerythrin HHE cation binding domain-containing protein n=1 Tax=Raineyella antarctica TaxID=1577474 RepID=A0A1G6HWJ2_9ACTN|nr:hemerythrin domain-containing protein [Raineyella antarctica]SDB98591.1 Hemerythrin HHE cation binding domain-containing protein [Raineyella antarctica]
MCNYCGCQEQTLIRDYYAEHNGSRDLADRARRQMDEGRYDEAREHVTLLLAELEGHWAGEEGGLFAVMVDRYPDDFADYIRPLVEEHRALATFLRELDVTDAEHRAAFAAQVLELHEHMMREEDSLFPASVVTFDGEDWTRAIDGWQQAHPGRELIAD